MTITAFSRARSALPALLLLAACAGGPSPGAVGPDQQRAALLDLQAADLRLATVAYRLAAAGGPICPATSALTGMTLHDASQYAPGLRDAARTAFGLDQDVKVLAVAADSLAAVADIRAGDAIISVAGDAVPAFEATNAADFARVERSYALLERAASAGSVPLIIRRAGRQLARDVTPVIGCASRVQLVPGGDISARADGKVLSVTAGLLAFTRNDDELAIVVAHEMAHNALSHRANRAPGEARSAATRATEREADRFGYYLMARADYDVNVSPSFWDRLYRGPAGGLFGPRTHLGRRERIDGAVSTIQEIEVKRATGERLKP